MADRELAKEYAQVLIAPVLKRTMAAIIPASAVDYINWKKVLEPSVDLYAKIFTDKELSGALKWHRSPIGRSINEKGELHFQDAEQAIKEGLAGAEGMLKSLMGL